MISFYWWQPETIWPASVMRVRTQKGIKRCVVIQLNKACTNIIIIVYNLCFRMDHSSCIRENIIIIKKIELLCRRTKNLEHNSENGYQYPATICTIDLVYMLVLTICYYQWWTGYIHLMLYIFSCPTLQFGLTELTTWIHTLTRFF